MYIKRLYVLLLLRTKNISAKFFNHISSIYYFFSFPFVSLSLKQKHDNNDHLAFPNSQLTEIFFFSNLASMASIKSTAFKNDEDKVVEKDEEEEEEEEDGTVSPTEVKMSQIVLPCHCNHQQELCVGQLLKWIDITACLSGKVAFVLKLFHNASICCNPD